MNRVLVALVCLLLPSVALAKLRVVATVPDLAAIASEVGGEHVHVTALALPTQDPHFVDAKPSLVLELSRADLLLLVGLELEVGWLPVLQTGSRNPAVQTGADGYLDASTLVQVKDVPAGPVDRSMGDLHGGGNPHYLYDPRNAVPIAMGIAARLGQLDPERADAYTANAVAFSKALDEARVGWEARLAPLRGASAVGYHRSLTYLVDWLGIEVIAEIEPKPGIPPTPTHVARVLERAKAEDARIVLQESFYPSTTSRLVAEKAGAELVVLPAGARFAAGQGYLAHVDEVVGLLEGAIR